MPRQITACRKNNPPRLVSYPAIQLSIDKIAKPAETETDRNRQGDYIGHDPEIEPVFPDNVDTGNDATDDASVKRHPTLPDGKYFKGMGKIPGKIVEEDITGSTA